MPIVRRRCHGSRSKQKDIEFYCTRTRSSRFGSNGHMWLFVSNACVTRIRQKLHIMSQPTIHALTNDGSLSPCVPSVDVISDGGVNGMHDMFKSHQETEDYLQPKRVTQKRPRVEVYYW